MKRRWDPLRTPWCAFVLATAACGEASQPSSVDESVSGEEQVADAAVDEDSGRAQDASADALPPADEDASPADDAAVPTCTGELCPADITFFAMGDCQYGGGPDRDKNFLQIAALNDFPGSAWPEGMPSAGLPVAEPRGLLLAGDITNSGRDGRPGDEGHNELGRFLDDYGLTGSDGLLRFPMYEGYGNHDFDPAEAYEGWRDLYPDTITPGVQAVIDRNAERVGMVHVSDEGGHYSWDWGGVHFVNLNLFPGNEPSDHHHTSLVRNPYHSLDFLAEDLATHVGDTCRPVILMSHYGFDSFSMDPLWWNDAQRDAFWQLAQDYNVVAYIHGHSHDTSLYTWNGMDVFNVGSPYYNLDGLGHFAVFRIHDDQLEAADASWDPDDEPTRATFRDPTDASPDMGWRLVKTIRRSCED
jgi:cytolysin (calcineurin-like family phosphatase)